jgi:hypothetical protein
LCRGSAAAAGLLLLCHEAGSQGNALLTYSWQRNALEVQFGVPPPQAALRVPPVRGGEGDAGEAQLGRGLATAPGLGLKSPPGSPRRQLLVDQPAVPSSPAAAAVAAAPGVAPELTLAELAEPLPEAAGAEAAVAHEAASSRSAPARQLGGPLAAPAADARGRVRLRVLLDGSALEAFTGSGEVGGGVGSRAARAASTERKRGEATASPARPGSGVLPSTEGDALLGDSPLTAAPTKEFD